MNNIRITKLDAATTLGILVLTADPDLDFVTAKWTPSPVPGALAMTRGELAHVLREYADALEREEADQ